jgi:hypothetical protein
MRTRQRRLRNKAGYFGSTYPLWSALYAGAAAGDSIVVGSGETVIMDVAQTPAYDLLTINGTVIVDRTKNTELRYNAMEIYSTGAYRAGTVSDPWPRGTFTHTLTPSGLRANDPSVGTPGTAVVSSNRGILVMDGGELSLYASVPTVNIFKLGATANVGATSIQSEVAVTLKAGDLLELTTTKFWDEGRHREVVTVTADVNNSTTIPVTALLYRHHGQLQYVVAPAYEDIPGTNLSYTPRTILSTDSFGTSNGSPYLGSRVLAAVSNGASTTIDNRCTAGLLTHPIKFGAPNDSDWTTHGYGAHLMVMGLNSKCMLQGVERYRVGQAGFLGRYPDHQHMRSYTPYGTTGSGTFLGDVNAVENFVKQCSTRGSSNRGSTIHGTCGFTLLKNVYSNTDTHCIFLEDGSEERNIIDGNLVSGVNLIGYGKTVIKAHDGPIFTYGDTAGPTGIWYTNPSNYLRNNVFSDCAGLGIWNAFSVVHLSVGTVTRTGTGNGTVDTGASDPSYIGRKILRGTAQPENIVLTAINSTTFSRVGSVSGAMSNVTVGTRYYAVGNAWNYTVNAGATPFVAGDTITIPCLRTGGCFGLSRDVLIEPLMRPILEWSNNETHSNHYLNMMTVPGALDEAGNVGDIITYGSTEFNGNLDDPNGIEEGGTGQPERGMSVFTRARMWKPGYRYYVNLANNVRYNNWEISAHRDSVGIVGIAGGMFQNWLAASRTLDDAYPTNKNAMMVSYHNGVTRNHCIFIGAPQTGFTYEYGLFKLTNNGGVMGLWDYYDDLIELGFQRDTFNAVLGANPGNLGYHVPPVMMAAFDTGFGVTSQFPEVPVANGNGGSNGSLFMRGQSGAWKLPSDGGYFNRDGWWVYCRTSDANDGFYTYGTTGGVFADSPTGYSNINGKILPSSYSFVGAQASYANTSVADVYGEAIRYTRFDSTGSTTIDTWSYPYCTAGAVAYYNMRHACFLEGGVYGVDFTDATRVPPPTTQFQLDLDGFFPGGAGFICYVPWANGSTVNNVQLFSGRYPDGGPKAATSVGSKAALFAATTFSYWKDSTGNRVWVNFKNPTPGVWDQLHTPPQPFDPAYDNGTGDVRGSFVNEYKRVFLKVT